MATRSATLTYRDGREIHRHYRHYDGYPECHGAEIAAALLANQPIDDATYLDELEDMGCEDESGTYIEHGDINFLYRVDLGRDAKITMWGTDWNHGYPRIMSHPPIFEGTPKELLEKFAPSPYARARQRLLGLHRLSQAHHHGHRGQEPEGVVLMNDGSVTRQLCELLGASSIDYASEQRGPTTYPTEQERHVTTHWKVGDASYSVTETFDADGDTATMRIGMLWPYAISPEQILSASLGGDVRLMLAQLGRRKAKAHPWGYEPDTGSFDTTRCECGELNDISARFCNRCGREIEIDMGTKELWDGTWRKYRTCEVMRDGSLRCMLDDRIYRTTDEPRDEMCDVVLDGEWSPHGEDDTEYVCEKCGYVMDDQYAWDSYQAGHGRKPHDHCPGCGRAIRDMHDDPSPDPQSDDGAQKKGATACTT